LVGRSAQPFVIRHAPARREVSPKEVANENEIRCRQLGAGMSRLRRRAQPEVSHEVETTNAYYVGIEDATVPLPRLPIEDWELRLALQVVELWLRVRPGFGFGPIGRAFAEAPVEDRVAAHELFVSQGLLFLHSSDLPAEFLIVKTRGSGATAAVYRSLYGRGDGLYRPLDPRDTLKEALMNFWVIQQARSPLPNNPPLRDER
jgi:hypothetical protein